MNTRSDRSNILGDLALLEKNVYLLKQLRGKLERISIKCSKASVYSNELERPIKPDTVKCKIKSVPERPQLDKNNAVFTRSKYLFMGAVGAGIVTVLFFFIVLFSLNFFTKPFATSGFFGKALIVFAGVSVFLFAWSYVLRLLEMLRFKEELASWEKIKLQINSQNEQEVLRCQREEATLNLAYEEELRKYEELKSVYVLREDVKSQLFELSRSKIHNLLYNAERQLANGYAKVSDFPREAKRIDAILMLDSYVISGKANGIDDALELYKSDIKNGSVTDDIKALTASREDYREGMSAVVEYMDLMDSVINDAVDGLNPLFDAIIEKCVSFETQSVNKSVLAIEFSKNYNDTSVAKLADEIIASNESVLKNLA